MIEVLVVVAIIALLISILLPSLAAAREGARTSVCLSNLKQMGYALSMYAGQQKGSLPGPIHLLLYRNTHELKQREAADPNNLWFSVNMPYYLGRYIGDNRQDAKLLDQVANCPTAGRIPVADDSDNAHAVYRLPPGHYIANTGSGSLNAQGRPTSFETRGVFPYYRTKVPNYFGYTNVPLARSTLQNWATSSSRTIAGMNLPKKIDVIKQAGREWALADLWYGDKAVPRGQPRSAGTWPYSVASGQPIGSVVKDGNLKIPSYPYHGTTRSFASVLQDASTSARWTTGRTNATFFDGHAESVRDWKGSANPCFDTNGDGECD